MREDGGLGLLVLVSLLVMLNMPLFFTVNTGMDLYGFFTLDPLAERPLPAVLATVLNVALAFAGFACYRWLWRQRGRFTGGSWGPFTRGALLSAVPVFLAYAPGIIFTSHGGKPSQTMVAGLIAGALCVTHALRDTEMKMDAALARYWFLGTVVTILVFLALAIGGMMLLYHVEQLPATSNLLWRWEYTWSELGYPRKEFGQRQRDALVGFTVIGSGYMIVVLGGSMLGAILPWTRVAWGAGSLAEGHTDRLDYPDWVANFLAKAQSVGTPNSGRTWYMAVLDGIELALTPEQYRQVVAEKDNLLRDVDLIVDKVAGDVYLWSDGEWTRLDFRVRNRTAGIRSGPFALLCIYARHPGRRFGNAELRALLEPELAGREWFNVRDFVSQLQRRQPRLPVNRDGSGSFLEEGIKVCLLDYIPPGDSSDSSLPDC